MQTEVEITSSAIQKMKLFAAMGVPEVWRHDGEQLQMFALQNGQYEPVPSSPVRAGGCGDQFASGETF